MKRTYPIYAQDITGSDYYLISSETNGKFIRNFFNGVSYCYMSCNCSVGEIQIVLQKLGSGMVQISKEEYLNAVEALLKRTIETLETLKTIKV